ncbi:MAG TPA: hypothetical protein V6D08_07020, partial [Candidatus Obscuribacterales bacterium]
MRLIYAAFMLGCLALITYVSAASWISSSPAPAAMSFLRTIRQGAVAEAAEMFGDNSCRCPPRGGWIALLKYEYGEEPSLAFLVGHPFEIGRPRIMPVKDNTPYVLPWEVPESAFVDVPLSFDAGSYSPLFLPLKLAYGQDMTLGQFQEALQDLRKDDWKGFSLRLRPSLAAGVVPPPPAVAEHKGPAPDKTGDDKAEASRTAELAKELFGAQAAQFLTPRDAASVTLPGGGRLSAEQVESRLPR